MKYLILASTFLLVSGAVLAQESVPEPEFNDVFVRLDAGKLVPLERETSTMHAGGGGFMVVGTKAANEFPGGKSPVRFQSNQPLEFIVRTPFAVASVDPSTMYVLKRLNAKKKSREAVFMTGHFSPLGGSTKTDMSQGAVPVTFTHYGNGSLKVITGPLTPGEYALSRLYGQEAFCFGVD